MTSTLYRIILWPFKSGFLAVCWYVTLVEISLISFIAVETYIFYTVETSVYRIIFMFLLLALYSNIFAILTRRILKHV